MPGLIYARNPDRLHAKNPRIIECLLDLNRGGYRETVSECIWMCRDLRVNGHGSSFHFSLQGYRGISELKPHTRGGLAGGARVYLFWQRDGRPILANAEYKVDGDDPDYDLIEEAVDMSLAVKTGRKGVI